MLYVIARHEQRAGEPITKPFLSGYFRLAQHTHSVGLTFQEETVPNLVGDTEATSHLWPPTGGFEVRATTGGKKFSLGRRGGGGHPAYSNSFNARDGLDIYGDRSTLR
jgi:hypothetical protein